MQHTVERGERHALREALHTRSTLNTAHSARCFFLIKLLGVWRQRASTFSLISQTRGYYSANKAISVDRMPYAGTSCPRVMDVVCLSVPRVVVVVVVVHINSSLQCSPWSQKVLQALGRYGKQQAIERWGGEARCFPPHCTRDEGAQI